MPCWFLSVLASALIARSISPTEIWPEFRGPTAHGHSDSTGLPLKWSETDNVTWKTAIHDLGWSSPVIMGNRIWLTSATEDGKKMYALCVDRPTGKVLLDRKLFDVQKPRPLGNGLNCYASPSPVIELGRVYVNFGSYGTACIDTESFKVLWQRRDLPCNHFRGPGSSPIIFENLLILHMDGSDFQYVVALDKKTGKNVWKTERGTEFNDLDDSGRPMRDGDFRKAFNTPLVITVNGEPQMISPASKAVYSYDPRTGKKLWSLHHKGHSTATRSVFGHGLVFVNTGSLGEMWAVRPDGRGDVTDTHVVWKHRRSVPRRASPLLIGDLLFMCSDKGIASCVEAKTGHEVWMKRMGGEYSSSPVYADQRVYFFNQDGKATVIRPGRTFELAAENTLANGFMASPAIAGKAFFLRTKTHLYRIEQ